MYRICKNHYGYFKIQKTVKKQTLWQRIFRYIDYIEVWKDIHWEDVNYAKFPKVTFNNNGVALFETHEDALKVLEYLIDSIDKEIKKNDNHWKEVERSRKE